MGHIAKNAAGWVAAWAILSECLQSKAEATDKAKVHWHTSRPCFPPRVPTLKCLAISKSINNSEILFRFEILASILTISNSNKGLHIFANLDVNLDLCTDQKFLLFDFETSHTLAIHHILLHTHYKM